MNLIMETKIYPAVLQLQADMAWCRVTPCSNSRKKTNKQSDLFLSEHLPRAF